MIATAPVQERPRRPDEAVPRWRREDATGLTAPVGPAVAQRAWDLHPGDHFHGRTIAAVHGVVGLASSPVAVISFTGHDTEHPSQARIGATHTNTDRGHDDLRLFARTWVRIHGLSEGQAVDLARLRSDVLAAIAPHCTLATAGFSCAVRARAADIDGPDRGTGSAEGTKTCRGTLALAGAARLQPG